MKFEKLYDEKIRILNLKIKISKEPGQISKIKFSPFGVLNLLALPIVHCDAVMVIQQSLPN